MVGLEGTSHPTRPTPAVGWLLPTSSGCPVPPNPASSSCRDGAPTALRAAVSGPHCPLSKAFLPDGQQEHVRAGLDIPRERDTPAGRPSQRCHLAVKPHASPATPVRSLLLPDQSASEGRSPAALLEGELKHGTRLAARHGAARPAPAAPASRGTRAAPPLPSAS